MFPNLNVTGIICKNSKDYILNVFNCFEKKEIVVPIKDTITINKYNGIVFDQVLDPLSDFGWIIGEKVVRYDSGIAQILFTSGTTGEPKGIVLTHSNLSDVVDRLNSIMGVDGKIREYIGVPVYHSFGFGRVRACLDAGGSAYIPEKGFDLLEIIKFLKEDKINAISVVPTLCRIILNQSQLIGDLGEKVLWIEIGSQYMSRFEKEQIKVLFPNAQIIQHYGLTEASRTTFLDITHTEGSALESVGRAVGEVEISISNDDTIKIRGPHVARQRLSSDGFVALVDSDGWLVTNDKGYIEGGYLFFQGRSDDVINCGGIKIYPEFVERELRNLVRCKSGIAVAKVKDQLRGDGILVAIEPHLLDMIDEIRTYSKDILKKLNVYAGEALHFEIIEHLPVTDTGKLKRKSLSEEFNNKYKELQNRTALLENDENKIERDNIVDVFRLILRIDDIRSSDSFLSLGGDSLSYVISSIAIENYLGYLPNNWEAITFSDFEKLKNNKKNVIDDKEYKYKSVCFFVLLIIFLLCGELFLQIRSQLKYGRSAFNIATNESHVIYNVDLGVKTYRPLLKKMNKETGTVLFASNSIGLRSPEISQDLGPRELRIAIVGSSTVVFASSNDDTISQLLEDELKTYYPSKVNVINGGIEGLTLSGICKVTQGLIFPLKPSIIVIYTGLNNISAMCSEKSKNEPTAEKLPIFQLPAWVMTREMIRKNTTFLTEQKTKNINLIDIASVDLSGYGTELEKLVSEIIDQGIVPVLMTNSRVYNNVSDSERSKYIKDALYYYYCFDQDDLIAVGDEFNNQIKTIASKYNLTLIDLASIMPGGRKFFASGSHFNLDGRRFVAKEIFQGILPLINKLDLKHDN